MHSLLVAFLALQSATIVAVLTQSPDTFLAVRIGDVILTAEFSSSESKAEKFSDGEQVRAEVRHGKMKVRTARGKTVEGRVRWVQRTLFPPSTVP